MTPMTNFGVNCGMGGPTSTAPSPHYSTLECDPEIALKCTTARGGVQGCG